MRWIRFLPFFYAVVPATCLLLRILDHRAILSEQESGRGAGSHILRHVMCSLDELRCMHLSLTRSSDSQCSRLQSGTASLGGGWDVLATPGQPVGTSGLAPMM